MPTLYRPTPTSSMKLGEVPAVVVVEAVVAGDVVVAVDAVHVEVVTMVEIVEVVDDVGIELTASMPNVTPLLLTCLEK